MEPTNSKLNFTQSTIDCLALPRGSPRRLVSELDGEPASWRGSWIVPTELATDAPVMRVGRRSRRGRRPALHPALCRASGEFDLLVRDAAGNVEHHVAVARPIDIEEALARFHADGRRELALRSARVTVTVNEPTDICAASGRGSRPGLGRIFTARSGDVAAGVAGRSAPRCALSARLAAATGGSWTTRSCESPPAPTFMSYCLANSDRSRALFVGVSAAGIPGVLDEVESRGLLRHRADRGRSDHRSG